MSGGERPQTAEQRREALKMLYLEAKSCTRCPELASTRSSVVFGAGNADADLMFVGEAPGASEDEQGVPFVGQAGKLLEKLLGEVGIARADVFIANTLKCLRYNAAVQLGDGRWERIGRLVGGRYSGPVMSVDRDGRIVPRRVVGWHATPLGDRRVFHLTYSSANGAGASRAGIELTGDHPVLTERGYVAVEHLLPTDRIAVGVGLSDLVRDAVCGTVLGGGSFSPTSAALSCAPSRRQRAYADFKESFASGEPRVMFDQVEVEEVSERRRADETFFCIDVEETNNFVTAGGVVHNCRPPNNRDPLPLEIENCREYLYEQVALIEPKVICTLGNFATKLLRDDKTGITKLHGRAELLAVGQRVVRLYPIFHPAAALYTPRMLETLREDFLRLPALLQMPAPEQPEPLEPLEPPEPASDRVDDVQRDQPSGSDAHAMHEGGKRRSASEERDDEAQLDLF